MFGKLIFKTVKREILINNKFEQILLFYIILILILILINFLSI